MKYVKYILIFTFLLFNFKVYANTCSYKEQTILNNDFSNVKITYEINDNQINILIYNITENLYISYTNPETKEIVDVHYNGTDKGKYTLNRNSNLIEEYAFEIRSNMSSCYGNILTTKKIVKPAYNKFYELEICKDKKLENHSYCQEFITSEINKSEEEVEQTLRDFLNAKVEKITTTTKTDKNALDVKTVITYSIGGLIVVGIVVSILLINKKRNEL